ncbi:hypothetical protein DL93DRAFT_579803 [Clavulina sp. PMI_390]|nr:hypothetical protein DL93DRAFT_579803 [Clavulina sp. PMI_390]
MKIIPEQVLLEILQNSGFLDIVRCRAVCRRWNEIISSSVALQYIVWLGIFDKEDGDSMFAPQSSVERLKILLEQEAAWANLAPRSREFPTIDRRGVSIRLSDHGVAFQIPGDHQTTLVFHSLPSMISKQNLAPSPEVTLVENLASWKLLWEHAHHSLYVFTTTERINADLSQPLLRLCATSIPETPHPSTQKPIVCGSDLQITPDSLDHRIIRTTIHDRLLLLEIAVGADVEALTPPAAYVVVWDWIAGGLIAMIPSPNHTLVAL